MSESARPTIAIQRHFHATVVELWDLWTTAEGIESWWGPEGFTVTVGHIDLRVAGGLTYTMTATAPDQIAFMADHGMPVATEVSITYTDVEPCLRLGFTTTADFVPGVQPYAVATAMTLEPGATGVTMEVTIDAMHDEEWTQRSVAGQESQLDRLAAVVTAQAARRPR